MSIYVFARFYMGSFFFFLTYKRSLYILDSKPLIKFVTCNYSLPGCSFLSFDFSVSSLSFLPFISFPFLFFILKTFLKSKVQSKVEGKAWTFPINPLLCIPPSTHHQIHGLLFTSPIRVGHLLQLINLCWHSIVTQVHNLYQGSLLGMYILWIWKNV